MQANPPVATETALVVSPNPLLRERVSSVLESMRWNADAVEGGAAALAILERAECPVMIVDGWLPDLHVSDLVSLVRRCYPQTELLTIDAESGDLRCAEGELKSVRARQLPFLLRRALNGDADPVPTLAPTMKPAWIAPPCSAANQELPGIVGSSPAMREVCRKVRLVAPRSTSVLITGETGVGKELIAKAVHDLSPRANKPLVVVNCAAIPETLLESELFGYARGAFTGAVQSNIGKIHAAHGGTLFLDEIGEMPLNMQAKLLRFMQSREIQRLGSTDVFKVDVRVVAATNIDLLQASSARTFRSDLYYRLSVFPIDVPAVRQRSDDVAGLAEYLLGNLAQDFKLAAPALSAESLHLLQRHSWPGNVRELQHALERALILAEGSDLLEPHHFPGVQSEIATQA